jgi:hypothetical protein
MSWPIFDLRVSSMLADGSDRAQAGTLDIGVHLPGEWLGALVDFIGAALPDWRDDPARPTKTAETALTAQLCARLNSLSRHARGWDFLQFKREEPDENAANRSIDLAVAPSGTIIWMRGRQYNEYETLLPIECKRLPTPSSSNRDAREYLYSKFNSTGGIHRFKVGHHGASHASAAMIGYVQDRDIPHWKSQLDDWVEGLCADEVPGWFDTDKLHLSSHDKARGVATLLSSHGRSGGLEPITLHHMWVEIGVQSERG